jgi:hypothetical protein
VTTPVVAPAGPLCAQWAREQEVDPIGSIGSYRCFLLVEWPLPWPRDLSDVPALAPLAAQVAAAGGRLQALVPSEGGATRAVLYDAGDGPFTRYARRETSGPAGDLVARASALLASRHEATPAPAAARDVLVCTHGSRDRCCGSLGTQLERRLAANGGLPGAGLWRTSHTGGHRFAPTALVFPEGTGWGFLDEATLSRVVTRSGPVGAVLPHYRGCAGLESGAVQTLERAVLAEVGWSLLDQERSGSVDGDEVRLLVRGPEGEREWTGTVEEGRTLPVPGCGVPLDPNGKTSTELVVREVRRTS